MPRILLVTNDFPPTVGGIQSYLRDYLAQLEASEVMVFASTQDPSAAAAYDRTLPFPVVRYEHPLMLPTYDVKRQMQRLIREHGIETVWFGAAAPLGVLGKAAKAAGATRVVVTTHGHEVGWSMLPVARQILRRIGRHADIITYISEYTLRRFRSAFGSGATYVWMPSGVDTALYHPATPASRAETRQSWGLSSADTVVVCVSRLVPRKGQDQLIRAIRELPQATLLIVGAGRDEKRLEGLAKGLGSQVQFLGRLELTEMRDLIAASDIFAMPARTRGAGLDVEGLGIVYLEAQACGIPVVAGNSGGAPETVTPESGIVVNGHHLSQVRTGLRRLIEDPELRRRMGTAGRKHVEQDWTWQKMGAIARSVL